MLISNFLSTRMKTEGDAHRGGFGIDPPGRDLDYECGYPEAPDLYLYRRLYKREGYAKRVVDVWPDESWAIRPEVYETEDDRTTKFERAWGKLLKKANVWHYLHRADRMSGLGRFGILLLGFSDGKSLDQPVSGINRRGEPSKKKKKKPIELIYLRPFSEESVEIAEVENDRSNPRYGQPRYYQVRITNPLGFMQDVATTDESVRVHWTRIIHLADNRDCNDLVGMPRMEPVLNRLLDIRKVLAGSAEMFWKGAFPGYSFETVPELVGESVLNEDTIREQFEEYMDGLKRYMAIDGATVKQLSPQVADPTKHIEALVGAIAAALTIPLRIFMGSEAAHLASTQDLGTWNKRVAERQLLYVEPWVIRPFVDRLIMVGVLPMPEEGYCISWRDMNTMSDKDKAQVSLQRAQALMQYVSGKVETVMPLHQFFTLILGLSPEEAESVVTAAESQSDKDMMTDPFGEKTAKVEAKFAPKISPSGAKVKVAKTQGGGRIGNPGKARTGRPAGKIAA